MLRAVRVRGRQFNSRAPSGFSKLAIDREMFSCSVDAGFVLALPFYHRDLEPDCVEASTRGAYAQDENTSARLCAKNEGGTYARGGERICGTLWYFKSSDFSTVTHT